MIESVSLIVTTRCNLSCKYCYYSYNSKKYIKSENFISFQQIKSLFCTLPSDRKLKEVVLTGGEPFLHSEIYKIIDFFDTYTDGVTVLTNGTLLDDAKVLWLKKRNIKLNISIDSLSVDYSDTIRGNHNRLMKVLDNLSKNNYKGVTLCPTLTSENIEDVIKLREYADLNGFNIAIGFVDLNKDNSLSLYNLASEAKNQLTRILEKKITNKYQRDFAVQVIKSLLEDSESKVLLPSCSSALSNIVINADGNIYPCFHRRELLGNIEDRFELIEKKHLEFFRSNQGKFSCIRTACLRV